ncbi:MAG: hypothetical protein Q8L55_10570 [Phycisphaerales bacterium]|nr:hypothetical protein [Phycisphaerales bacterium]
MKIAAVLVLALAGTAMAQTLDGTRDGSYANLFSQNNQTGFGDNFSELNNFSWSSSGGNLYIFVGGNIENNGNRMVFFFGTSNAGQSTLSGLSGDGSERLGVTFDAGFGNASRMISANNGSGTLYVNHASFAGAWSYGYAGNSAVGGNAFAQDGGDTSGIQAILNNSNTGGVTGGSGTFDPNVSGAVSTGLELCIPLAWLGYTSGPITVAGWVAGGNYGYASNQFVGGFQGGQGNLGSDGNGNYVDATTNFDLNDFDGDQYVTIVPTPGVAGLLGLGALAMGRRRR